MRHHIWYEATQRVDQVRVRAVTEQGARLADELVHADAAARRAEELQAGIELASRESVVDFHDLSVPDAVRALWEAEGAADEMSPADLRRHARILRDESHLCDGCVMRSACVVGRAASDAERMLVVVGACLGYQPDDGSEP